MLGCMKLSQFYVKTYKEDPQDAEVASHKLLVRAGYIKKQAAGSYIFMPLGIKVMQKINDIVREEMNKAGANEVLMPMLLGEEVYENRIKTFGSSMFRLRDRNGKGLCLGPTHEEVFTGLIKDTVSSYKSLPINLYQIGTKFRDEIRPRFGLQRAREFVMKDAYSYDTNLHGLEKSFENMKQTYSNIFDRLGLKYVIVDADNGSMGGYGSNEFMVKSVTGEDELAVCDACGYGANIEKAEVVFVPKPNTAKRLEKQKIHTPNLKTIEEVSGFLKVSLSDMVKVVAYQTDKEQLVLAYLRGDREVEEIKLAHHVAGATELSMAEAITLQKAGVTPGYIGPNKDFKDVLVLVDNEIQNMANFVMGANETDYHFINCNLDDLYQPVFADIRKVVAGDMCPKCHKPLSIIRGIEVGHIFKLGTHYTKQLNCNFLDENGKEQTMYMGCYGIGVSRALSAVVEQNHDDNGIIWDKSLAPFAATIFAANAKDDTQTNAANKLYKALIANGVDVLLDDRKDSYGVKMKDAQLMGMPFAIIAGRKIEEGLFEVVTRKTNEVALMKLEEVLKLF